MPTDFRGAYRVDPSQRTRANECARDYLRGWLDAGGDPVEGIGRAAVMACNSGGRLQEVRVCSDAFVGIVASTLPRSTAVSFGDLDKYVKNDEDGPMIQVYTPAGPVTVRMYPRGASHHSPAECRR